MKESTSAVARALLVAAPLAAALLASCSSRPAAPPPDPFVATVHRIEPAVVLFTMQLPSDDA